MQAKLVPIVKDNVILRRHFCKSCGLTDKQTNKTHTHKVIRDCMMMMMDMDDPK